jgi:hypothetical protein
MSTVVLFVLGSGLIGGARSGATLLAGRAIQGDGAGLMVDLVVCDLVPLRERGKYMGMIFDIGVTRLRCRPTHLWRPYRGPGPVLGGDILNKVAYWRDLLGHHTLLASCLTSARQVQFL